METILSLASAKGTAMRIAAVIALFVVAFAAVMLGVVAPAAGQTIPPPRPTEPPPLTPYPTATPNGCDAPGCLVPTRTPDVPTPDRPPLEPTAEIGSAFPGMREHYNYLVFFPKVGRQ